MKNVIFTALGLALFPVALGCGSTAGTQPHAMSATEHEAAASQEQQADTGHGEQYDPTASATKKSCSPARGGGAACWTSVTNPTAEHAKEAEEHRELASKHRAASEALRSAEASACAGIPEEDRDLSPFAHREDIRSVSPLREETKIGRSVSYANPGVEIVFRAVPGMTAEWLQRVVDCHLARNAAIGHEAAGEEMSFCPLTLRDVQASVRSVGDGFAVAIRSSNADVSKEIQRRAEAFQPAAVAKK
jgi:hypothetical protein